jgi:flagellar biosynthetic protein FliP
MRFLERPAVRFVLHFAEMMLAMGVGMMLIHPLWGLLVPGLDDRPGPDTLLMGVDMAIGMGVWMRVRGHDWRMITEMSAAMVGPFVVLLVPYLVGALSADAYSAAGHVLMVVAMLAIMLVRRHHYSQPQGWAWSRARVTAA